MPMISAVGLLPRSSASIIGRTASRERLSISSIASRRTCSSSASSCVRLRGTNSFGLCMRSWSSISPIDFRTLSIGGSPVPVERASALPARSLELPRPAWCAQILSGPLIRGRTSVAVYPQSGPLRLTGLCACPLPDRHECCALGLSFQESVHHFDVDVQAVVNTFLWRTVIHIALTAARRRLDCIHVGLVADGLVENLRCRLPDGLLRLNTFRSTSELRCDVLADGFCFTECCYAPRHFAFSFSAFAVWVVWTLGDRPELHPRSA